MIFYTGDQFPEAYRNSAFIALHGSINRLDLVGYSLVEIPFVDGKPSGPPRDFLTGFIVRDDDVKEVWGRPVDVLQATDGSLLVSDDAGKRIFRISFNGTRQDTHESPCRGGGRGGLGHRSDIDPSGDPGSAFVGRARTGWTTSARSACAGR
jgi:hypothetical protein